MPAIWELVPDPEMLITLEPEEPGGVLLQVYSDAQGTSNVFSPNEVAFSAFRGDPPRYPEQYKRSVPLAMAEATQWLEAAGFIIQAPEQSTSYKTLTRRGRRLASAA